MKVVHNLSKFYFVLSSIITLQIVDNHVIKYIPPEQNIKMVKPLKPHIPRYFGGLIVGAESADPQMVCIIKPY